MGITIRIFLSLIYVAAAATGDAPPSRPPDVYKNFRQLSQANVYGVDYDILTRATGASVLVMAFHGGFIEPGTTELADAIAGDAYDFYSFRALKRGQPIPGWLYSPHLHVTSSHFDEPKLRRMMGRTRLNLAIHGFGGREADFCLGGLNTQVRASLLKALRRNHPTFKSCELCCPPFHGLSKRNPVNRSSGHGVQVEISPRVRQRILDDPAFKSHLAGTFREVLQRVPEGATAASCESQLRK